MVVHMEPWKLSPTVAVAAAAQSCLGRLPKLVLLGDFGAGKSSLFHRLVTDAFVQPMPGAEDQGEGEGEGEGHVARPKSKRVRRNDRRGAGAPTTVRLPDGSKALLCDTCGLERFNRSLTNSYYRDAACVILVADASNLRSVQNLEYWNNEADCYAEDALKVLVFSKCDSSMADPHLVGGEIESYRQRLKCCRSAVVSSKTGRGISDLLRGLAEVCQMHRNRAYQNAGIVVEDRTVRLDQQQRDGEGEKRLLDIDLPCC